MAFDDSFRERSIIEADDVHRLCRIRKKAEVFDLVGFGAPMTEWSRRVEEVGETIVPRQVYLARTDGQEQDHRVAWVYHSRPLADEVIDQHHIACDCVADLDFDKFDEEIVAIVECPAVLAALNYRAGVVNKTLLTQQILDFYGKPEGSVVPGPRSAKVIKALVNFIMNYEQTHPEGWVANLVSGKHQVPLLATILQIQTVPDPDNPDTLSMLSIVQDMHADGSLVLDDDEITISLPIAA